MVRRVPPALPPTAPPARCTPPTMARSIRSSASRTAGRWTSASYSPSHHRPRMAADMLTRPRRMHSAPTRSASSTSSTTSRVTATTSIRRRPDPTSQVRPRADSTPNQSRTWRQITIGSHIDFSGRSLIQTPSQWAPIKLAVIHAGTKLASRGFYLLGDTLTVGTGRHQELVKVASVDTAGANGTDVDLAAPLQFDHQSGVDVSDVGPGSASRPPRNSRT